MRFATISNILDKKLIEKRTDYIAQRRNVVLFTRNSRRTTGRAGLEFELSGSQLYCRLKMGIRIILITVHLASTFIEMHATSISAVCESQLRWRDLSSIKPLSIEFLVDIIYFDGHRPTGNLPVARRPSPSLYLCIISCMLCILLFLFYPHRTMADCRSILYKLTMLRLFPVHCDWIISDVSSVTQCLCRYAMQSVLYSRRKHNIKVSTCRWS